MAMMAGGEDAFCRQRAHESLEVGRETEVHGLGVVEEGLTGCDGRDELGTPNGAVGAGDAQFVRVARRHVHDVGHEGESGKLGGEVTAEEPEVAVGGVCLLEVMECNGRRHPALLDRGKSFEAHGRTLRRIFLGRVSC